MKDLSELQSQIESLKAEIRRAADEAKSSKGLYELKKASSIQNRENSLRL